MIEDKSIEEMIEEINKIKEDENKQVSIKTIQEDTEIDYSKTLREGILDFSSFTMIQPEKRVNFAKDLKQSKVLNDYIDNELYTKYLKTHNPHIRASIVYSYLYMKNYNVL